MHNVSSNVSSNVNSNVLGGPMPSNEASFSGGCLCGAVRYRASGPGRDLCFCHCRSCRRATGAPSVPWVTFERASFQITNGALREYHSSTDVQRGFCDVCGTTLTYHHQKRPQEIDVTMATLDAPEALRPEAHIWVEDKLSWIAIGDGLPQYALTRGEAEASFLRTVRPGYSAVSARIVVDDVEGLARFVREVFEATGDCSAAGPTELRIGDSTLMISAVAERPRAPAFLYVYVGDVEATFERAAARGARLLESPRDTPYGDRRCMFEDPWGNSWQAALYRPPSLGS